jgi:hypothetical protein
MNGDQLSMHDFRAKWRANFAQKSIMQLRQESAWWEDMIVQYPANFAEDLKILEEFDDRIGLLEERLIKQAERDNPLAFFIPTYEQAEFLNAWSPEFDPERAPEGYNSVCNMGGKRSLKSTSTVVNAALWVVPNDPEWSIFHEHKDPHGRGKYRVFRRPMYDHWQRTGRMVYERDEPPVQDRIIWHGCPDEQHWKRKIEKQYRRWFPMRYIKKHADGKSYVWNLSERYFDTAWNVQFVGMLYKSDIHAWGGDELFMTIFDEGPPREVVDEVVARSRNIAWAYTPNEPANVKDRVQVARAVYDGTMQLIGQTYVMKSDMRKVPDRIIPTKELAKRVASLSTRGEAGEAAMAGGFFDSSPRVFDLFDRNRHVLPIAGEQVRRWIKAEYLPGELKAFPWARKFEGANIIRGFDEGFVHNTGASWVALLKSGERVIFREFEKSATSIKERVEKIVSMSGNSLREVNTGFAMRSDEEMQAAHSFGREIEADRQREEATGQQVRRFREVEKGELIRKTFGDSKLFKRDPEHLMDTWGMKYIRAGLRIVRATTRLPQERCSYTNGMFRANASRTHLNPAQFTEEHPYGYDLYVTNDCHRTIERLERYLWETVGAGSRKGSFTGKPEKDDDDLVDAFCYATNDELRWTPNEEIQERRSAYADAA